jgi:PncC family amidohydrolase
MTDVAGSSGWFDCGISAYSYEAKQALLGVRPETLIRFGASSEETVLEMVSRRTDPFGASIGVAVTGIAGPTGGTSDKPVGTVWIRVEAPRRLSLRCSASISTATASRTAPDGGAGAPGPTGNSYAVARDSPMGPRARVG